MIKAFLFDMDGVLADSAAISGITASDYFSSLGYRITPSDLVPHMGKGMKELYLGMARTLGIEIDVDDALRIFRLRYSSLLAQRERVKGAREFVLSAKAKGIKVAVASSSPSWRVDENLGSMGLGRDDFDAVLTEESVERNKPYPDIWLKAMERVGVEPGEALVFEDTLSGIESGKKSDARVVVMTATLGREKAEESKADYVLSSFLAFPSFTGPADIERALLALKETR